MSKATSSLRALQLQELAQLPEARLYHLTGGDDFLREEVATRVRNQVLEPDFRDFNYRQLRCAANTKVSLLEDALAELPVMAERRLLELVNPAALPPKGLEAVVRAHQSQPELILLLAWDGGSKKKLDSPLLQSGVKLICEVDEKERPLWLKQRAAALKLKFGEGAQETLLQRVGSDLRLILSHLEKLKLYCGEEPCSAQVVTSLVPLSAEVQTWKLTAAVGKKNLQEAYQTLDALLERDEPAGSLLSYLNTYLVGLAQLKHLKAQLRTPAAIAQALPKKSEYQIKRNLEEAESFSDSDLRTAFDRIERADLRIKTGSDPRMMLQLLVLQICSRKG